MLGSMTLVGAKRTLDMHLVDLQEALDPENCVEDEYNPVHNKAYVWRGLRLLAAEQLSSMMNVSGERFDQLMAKEGRLKLPEKKSDHEHAAGSDEAFAAYMAAQTAKTGGEKKRPRPVDEPGDTEKPAAAEQADDATKKGKSE
jgi:ketosteroid isomerase-like protein